MTAAILALFLAAAPPPPPVPFSWAGGEGMLLRTPAHPRPPRPVVPVLLVQDLALGPEVWNLKGVGGLAPALARAGFEVWSLDFDWKTLPGLGAYGTQVVDAAVRKVRALAGRPPLLVGHGVGGRAILEWLAAGGETPRVALLAPPSEWEVPNESVRALLAEALAGPPEGAVRPGDLSEAGRRALDLVLFNDGLPHEREIERAFYEQALRPVPRRLLRDGLEGSSGGGEGGSGPLAPRIEGLRRVRAAILVLAGQVDSLVPPWLSFPLVEALDRPAPQWRMFGRVNADRRELGHLGLLLGCDARSEVDPILIRWLRGDPWRWFRSEETFF